MPCRDLELCDLVLRRLLQRSEPRQQHTQQPQQLQSQSVSQSQPQRQQQQQQQNHHIQQRQQQQHETQQQRGYGGTAALSVWSRFARDDARNPVLILLRRGRTAGGRAELHVLTTLPAPGTEGGCNVLSCTLSTEELSRALGEVEVQGATEPDTQNLWAELVAEALLHGDDDSPRLCHEGAPARWMLKLHCKNEDLSVWLPLRLLPGATMDSVGLALALELHFAGLAPQAYTAAAAARAGCQTEGDWVSELARQPPTPARAQPAAPRRKPSPEQPARDTRIDVKSKKPRFDDSD
jgi:hypothetical protein